MVWFITILLILDTLALCALFVLAGAQYAGARERKAEKKSEENVEREMKRDFMDEGFENIMSYSVGGKNGFDDR